MFCDPTGYLDAWNAGRLHLDRERPDRPGPSQDQPQDQPPDLVPEYSDMAVAFGDATAGAPEPAVLYRDDGVALLYRGKVNVLYGDSESGKTWLALCALAEELLGGGRAAFVDLDHNGAREIGGRLVMLGVPEAVLKDQDHFRHAEPHDAAELDWFIADLTGWAAQTVCIDSLGEVLPMLGLSSNSPDDYTSGNRRVLTPLADSGAAVIAIDHLPKDDNARQKGQTGTLAKKRAVNGATLRVTVKDQFAPGRGGVADLHVTKDRPGGLREHCPPGRDAPAGRFRLIDNGDGTLAWEVRRQGTEEAVHAVPVADLVALDAMPAKARTRRGVQDHLGCGSDRAQRTLRVWLDLQKRNST